MKTDFKKGDTVHYALDGKSKMDTCHTGVGIIDKIEGSRARIKPDPQFTTDLTPFWCNLKELIPVYKVDL